MKTKKIDDLKAMDPVLSSHLMKKFMIGIVLVFCGLLVTAFSKEPEYLIICIAGLFMFLDFYNTYNDVKNGKIGKYELYCMEKIIPTEKETLFHVLRSGGSYLILQNDQKQFVRIPVNKDFACEPGNTVTIYTYQRHVVQENEDTFRIGNYIAIRVTKKNI